MRNELSKLADLKIGVKRTNQEAWASGELHGINPLMEDGLDRRRVHALADVIEALPVMAPLFSSKPWTDGPIVQARFVDGRLPVKGYILRDGSSSGLGVVQFGKGQGSDAEGYYLSGYGIICWAWGMQMGMAAVAGNGLVNELQQVLTAEPVMQRELGSYTITKVTLPHIAQALRAFCETRDAKAAWQRVANADMVEHPELVPKVEAKPEPEPKPALTRREHWKMLMHEERYQELLIHCENEAERLRKQIEALEAERHQWAKRATAAKTLMED